MRIFARPKKPHEPRTGCRYEFEAVVLIKISYYIVPSASTALSFFRFEQLREDKADVVAFLKRALQQRTDQISELQARLEGLQHVHETDGKAYEKRIADMQQEVSTWGILWEYSGNIWRILGEYSGNTRGILGNTWGILGEYLGDTRGILGNTWGMIGE